MQWVDRVMRAMGFGCLFWRWVAALHWGARAAFMLHSLSPVLLILFSVRQGDPLAMLLFVIQIEPLLAALERELHGLHVGLAREASFGYVDDVLALGTDIRDLGTMDRLVAAYEAASSAILNWNRKSVIVGLGQ